MTYFISVLKIIFSLFLALFRIVDTLRVLRKGAEGAVESSSQFSSDLCRRETQCRWRAMIFVFSLSIRTFPLLPGIFFFLGGLQHEMNMEKADNSTFFPGLLSLYRFGGMHSSFLFFIVVVCFFFFFWYFAVFQNGRKILHSVSYV